MAPEDQARVAAVTAALTGELYVGARVRFNNGQGLSELAGTITKRLHDGQWIVRWDGASQDHLFNYYRDELVLI